MTEATTNHLSQVLARVSALASQNDPDIPVLTQEFEGGFSSPTSDEIPILTEVVQVEVAPATPKLDIEKLVKQMLPLVDKMVHVVVNTELKRINFELSDDEKANLHRAIHQHFTK